MYICIYTVYIYIYIYNIYLYIYVYIYIYIYTHTHIYTLTVLEGPLLSRMLSHPLKNWGILFQCKQYFNSVQLFKLYTGFICPYLEYCSHIWGTSPFAALCDRVESKAIHLIGDPFLTSTLNPPSLHCKVASLCLFYRYYLGHCSDELTACIPMAQSHSTHQASFAHSYCVELSNARIHRFSDGFFPSTSPPWNSFPSSIFPASFNLLPSKCRFITTLGTRWHDFLFIRFFSSTIMSLLLFKNILAVCLIT